MQFDPDLYPVRDFKFIPSTSLGIIAREYEVTQLVQLLQTMDKQSPMYPLLLESIIDHMNVSNREELIATLKQAGQPDPQQQQLAQQQAQMQMAQLQAQIEAFAGQAAESKARAEKYNAETQLAEYEAMTDRIKALSVNLETGVEDDKEFERRARVADLMLKEKQITASQKGATNANTNRNATNLGPSEQPVRLPEQQDRETGGRNAEILQALAQAQNNRQG
jgi:hypothetical protein